MIQHPTVEGTTLSSLMANLSSLPMRSATRSRPQRPISIARGPSTLTLKHPLTVTRLFRLNTAATTAPTGQGPGLSPAGVLRKTPAAMNTDMGRAKKWESTDTRAGINEMRNTGMAGGMRGPMTRTKKRIGVEGPVMGVKRRKKSTGGPVMGVRRKRSTGGPVMGGARRKRSAEGTRSRVMEVKSMVALNMETTTLMVRKISATITGTITSSNTMMNELMFTNLCPLPAEYVHSIQAY